MVGLPLDDPMAASEEKPVEICDVLCKNSIFPLRKECNKFSRRWIHTKDAILYLHHACQKSPSMHIMNGFVRITLRTD